MVVLPEDRELNYLRGERGTVTSVSATGVLFVELDKDGLTIGIGQDAVMRSTR